MNWLGYKRVIPNDARREMILTCAPLLCLRLAADHLWRLRRSNADRPEYWDERETVRAKGKWPDRNRKAETKTKCGWCYVLTVDRAEGRVLQLRGKNNGRPA